MSLPEDESGKAFGQAWYYRTSKNNEYIIAQQFYMGGASQYVVYQSKNGKVKYKATKTFSLMTKPGGKTKASVKVAAGATFKINKAYAKKVKYASGYVGYDYYYRVTYKGVTGWIPEEAEFKNLDY